MWPTSLSWVLCELFGEANFVGLSVLLRVGEVERMRGRWQGLDWIYCNPWARRWLVGLPRLERKGDSLGMVCSGWHDPSLVVPLFSPLLPSAYWVPHWYGGTLALFLLQRRRVVPLLPPKYISCLRVIVWRRRLDWVTSWRHEFAEFVRCLVIQGSFSMHSQNDSHVVFGNSFRSTVSTSWLYT